MPDAFYLPIDDHRFRSTEHTVGPWDPAFQHAGPPSALLAREVETTPAAWPAVLTRVAVEILGPVPVAELQTRTDVVRSGRSVELVTAELSAAGRTVMRASVWRIRRSALQLPGLPTVDVPRPRSPQDSHAQDNPWSGGYLDAMEWRVAGGDWSRPGPATVWARMRYPLLPDEEPSGVQRTMALADSGNGVSYVLPLDAWFFINTDLTVHFEHEPQGEWICLDAMTTIDDQGFGLAASTLWDEQRRIARGAQSLYVGPR